MASCLTSRLGAVRYLEEKLIPELRGRLQERGAELQIQGEITLPSFTQAVVAADAIPELLEGEFPPSCRKNIEPCMVAMREHRGAHWDDAWEQVIRTLVTCKLYLEAQDESQIARKMAAIQKMAQTLESYFTEDHIYDFLGGIRECLGLVPRYSKDPETTFAACVFFEKYKSFTDLEDLEELADLCEEGDVSKLQSFFSTFCDWEKEFNENVERIQQGNPD